MDINDSIQRSKAALMDAHRCDVQKPEYIYMTESIGSCLLGVIEALCEISTSLDAVASAIEFSGKE